MLKNRYNYTESEESFIGENDTITNNKMSGQLTNSELVIGLVCTVGTNISTVIDLITNQLKNFGYDSTVIKISK